MASGLGSTVLVDSTPANMASAKLHPEVIDEYLRKELDMGCMLGPIPLHSRHRNSTSIVLE